MDLWVVGAGGLLGSAVCRRCAPDTRIYLSPHVPWDEHDRADAALSEALDDFAATRDADAPWAIYWAAGTGVVSSGASVLADQGTTVLALAERVASRLGPDGTFFFASSASVFGDSGAEFDERSPSAPASAYAIAKLQQEDGLRSIFTGAHVPRLTIARFSTLYGPGQNLAKRQGLISSMCLEAFRSGVITLFVPLDSTRDYLYVDDAADMSLDLVCRAVSQPSAEPVLHVVASHRATTLGEVARTVQAVIHRRTHVIQAAPATSVHQRKQSLRSLDPALADFRRTPLSVGIGRVSQDVLRRLVSGAMS